MALTREEKDTATAAALDSRVELGRYASRFLRTLNMDADELVHGTIERFLKYLELPSARAPRSVLSFLKTTLKNVALDEIKREERRRPRTEESAWQPFECKLSSPDDELSEELSAKAAKRLRRNFEVLMEVVRRDAPSPPTRLSAVDYQAVLLLELRMSLAPACGAVCETDQEDVALLVEHLMRWQPAEARRSFKLRWPQIGRIWLERRAEVETPPHRIRAASLCQAVADLDAGVGPSIAQWYQWTKRARRALRDRIDPAEYTSFFGALLGEVESRS